jgi:small subunit ribosomal protein S20
LLNRGMAVPNLRSSKKRMRQSNKLRTANRVQRAAVRTAVKKVRQAVTAEEAEAAFKSAQRLLDRAARKNLIPKSTAARNKRRLHAVVAAVKQRSS